jgi:CTP synthase
MKNDIGRENVMYIHVTLIPYLNAAGEVKTKPTQHSVKELRSIGIQPHLIVCRTEHALSDDLKRKIAQFCDTDSDAVIECIDAETLYEVPLMLQAQHMDEIVLRHLGIEAPRADMTEWRELVRRVKSLEHSTEIAIVGKYVALHDAYLSIVEALGHAGIECNSEVNIRWVNAEEVYDHNVAELLSGVQGILVPGGFGDRGIEGKIAAIRYAREQRIPFFGICLGMQVAVIEYARNVLGYAGANSSEINPDTPYPVIDLLPEQKDIENLGGTMRLGLYPCKIEDTTLAFTCYKDELIYERHRHRYEFNNAYRDSIESAGLKVSGTSPDGRLVEMVEIPDHPWFLAVQFHPEFTSRPNRPQPLFREFVSAALRMKS